LRESLVIPFAPDRAEWSLQHEMIRSIGDFVAWRCVNDAT